MAKLKMTPIVIPNGLLWSFFPAIDEDSTIGSTGQMQGARIVTKPAKNENSSNNILILYYTKFILIKY